MPYRSIAVLAGLLMSLFISPTCKAQKVVWEHRFQTEASVSLWYFNPDIDDISVTPNGLHCRGKGGDPLMIFRQPFAFSASAYQAIEVRMRASKDGTSQVFWTNTHEGKYGGFAPEKDTRFRVRGDEQFHTYRILPFWQKEGNIIQLRFDPYQGADFDIAWIRVIDLTPEAAATPLTTLTGVTLSPGTSGAALRLAEPGGMAMSLLPAFEATTNPVVSIQATCGLAHSATLLFATDEQFGIQQKSFELLGDGKPHVYNLDLLSVPEWKGHIVALGLRPGNTVGDEVTVTAFAPATSASGPADLRVTRFGIEEPLPAAGLPLTLAVTVTNAGGQPARLAPLAVTAKGAGVRITPLSLNASELRFGDEITLRWRVVASVPGTVTFDVNSAGSMNGLHAVATERMRPASKIKADYVPLPRPNRGTVPVGAYYFPGWKTAGQWAPITRFPERRPVLGWYREGSPEVADWHIKWAVEHGITFLAYDWYWQQGAQQLDHALKDGLFKARYRSMLDFCLLWANHNAPGSSSEPDCLNVTDFWLKNYFNRKEYLRVDGKPVVIIFSPYRFREDIGSANVKQAFEKMRLKCAAARGTAQAPIKGLYLIACVNSAEEARVAQSEGYDAVTGYNWPGLGMEGDSKNVPYAALPAAYHRQWDALRASASIPQLVLLSGGWDNRAWAGDAALVRSNRRPEMLREHVADGLNYVQQHPKSTLPMLLVEAWNEFGEGSYIEPQKEYGFGYLDAILNGVSAGAHPHTDLTPMDIHLPVPQVEFTSLERHSWRFDTRDTGWDSVMDATQPSIAGGVLRVETLGRDPALFGPPILLQASEYRSVHIRMRLSPPPPSGQADSAQLFWSTRLSPANEAASMRFAATADGEWHDYTVPVGENPRWRGQITRLRFDPCERKGAVVEISQLDLEPVTKGIPK